MRGKENRVRGQGGDECCEMGWDLFGEKTGQDGRGWGFSFQCSLLLCIRPSLQHYSVIILMDPEISVEMRFHCIRFLLSKTTIFSYSLFVHV